MRNEVIEFFGGPLDGTKHELMVDSEWLGYPSAIAMPVTPDKQTVAWYTRNDQGEYHYTKTEKRV